MLDSTIKLLERLKVYPENMMRNLELSKGLIMAESLMINLTLAGLPRHEAHELVMKLSREAESNNTSLLEVALKNETIIKLIGIEKLKEILDPKKYLGVYDKLIDRSLNYAKEATANCI
jgi:adenylosuccinate lyase